MKEREKAIAFARWLNENGYREYDESDRWISLEKTGQRVYTTAQLYGMFEDEVEEKRFLKILQPFSRTQK